MTENLDQVMQFVKSILTVMGRVSVWIIYCLLLLLVYSEISNQIITRCDEYYIYNLKKYKFIFKLNSFFFSFFTFFYFSFLNSACILIDKIFFLEHLSKTSTQERSCVDLTTWLL